MRAALSPDILADPPLAATPALATERGVWAQVCAGVQDIRALAPDDAETRVASLRPASPMVSIAMATRPSIRVT